jgi:hypothetical protein
MLVLGGLGLAVGGAIGWYPEFNRETSKAWVHQGWNSWSLKTGVELGIGATTRLGSPLWFAIPISAIAEADPTYGAALFGGYGLIRGGLAVALGYSAIPSTKLLAGRAKASTLGRGFSVVFGLSAILLGA